MVVHFQTENLFGFQMRLVLSAAGVLTVVIDASVRELIS